MEYLYYGWIDKYMVFSICMCVIVVVKKIWLEWIICMRREKDR